MTTTTIIIAISWLTIGVILGYRREESNAKYNQGFERGLLMIGSIIACPIVLVFAVVMQVFMRPWEKNI